MAGHVPIVIYQVPSLASNIQSGQIKAIAVLSPERTPLLPNTPTPGEQGVENFDATAWMGLFGPARLLRASWQACGRSLPPPPPTRRSGRS
ncbi:tripartite tricarboxylate transporter substrate-binding protein [Pseudoroseomonas wenyumeiae]